MSDKSERVELIVSFWVFVYTFFAFIAFVLFLAFYREPTSETNTENNVPYHRECDCHRHYESLSK